MKHIKKHTMMTLILIQVCLTGCYENQYTELSAYAFKESIENNGKINDYIDYTLSEYWFKSSSGVVSPHLYKIHGEDLPEGIVLKMQYMSGNRVRMTLDGQAQNHAKPNSKTFVIEFRARIFDDESDIPYNRVHTLTLDFYDEHIELLDTTLFEDPDMHGAISTNTMIVLHHYTFTQHGDIDPSLYTIENLPEGLQARIKTNWDKTAASIIFEGTAIFHEDTDDLNNIILTLSNQAIENYDIPIEPITMAIDYQ